MAAYGEMVRAQPRLEWGVLLAIGLLAATVHLLWFGGQLDTTWVVLVCHHVFDVIAAVVTLVMCIGSGAWLLRKMAIGWERPSEELVVAAACGIGVVASAMIVVSLVAGVNWLTMGAVLTGMGWICRREIVATPALIRAAMREVLMAPYRRSFRVASTLGLGAIVLALVGLAIAPPTDYDALAYHLQVPKQWFAAGYLFLPPDNYHTAFVGVTEFLYLPLLSVGADSAPQLLSVGFLLLLPVAAFATARTVSGVKAAPIAFWLTLGSPILFVTAVTPMVDVTLAFVLLVATWALLRGLQDSGDSHVMVIGGALLGVGAGIKYLGLLYALAVAPLMVSTVIWRMRHGWPDAMRAATLTVVAGLLCWAPWALKNVIMFGNPVFPYLSAPRVEPWLQKLYPNLTPAGVGAGAQSLLTPIRQPLSVTRLLFRPESVTATAYGGDSAPFWVLCLAPFALLARCRRRVAMIVGPALLYIGLLLGYSRYTNLRYLIPAIPGLTVGAAVVVAMLEGQLSRTSRYVLRATVVVLCLPAMIAVLNQWKAKSPLGYVLGKATRHEYLSTYWETAPLMPVVDWVNTNVPRDGVVLLLFEARGYYFQRRVLEDLSARNWPYLRPLTESHSCLRRLGITHVVVNEGNLRYFLTRGMNDGALGWDRFEPFATRCLTLLYRTPGVAVYSAR